VRSQYKEAFVVVRCLFEGRTYSRCVFIWVDKDFAILRGIHQGYPKKLGSIHQTRPHPLPHGAPTLAPGDRFGATLAAADRRLAHAVIVLRERSDTAGFVNGHPMAHHRWLPAIDGVGDAHAEVVESGAAEVAVGDTFAADVETFEVLESPSEELADLPVHEIIGAYYRRIGVTWSGGRTLA
jgi:acetoacetate decarboxylase